MEEVEGGFGAHAVSALEVGDGGAVGEAELGIEPADFGVFVGDPSIAPDEVAVAAFDHERAGDHERGHFRIIKGLAEIPVGHFPFDGLHETERLVRGGDLARPLVEIAGADGEAVFLQQGRDA